MSKRVWDALEGVAYQDDQVVRLRVAGVLETGPDARGETPSLEQIDLSDLSADVAAALLSLVASEERHILYVEVGPLSGEMFVFNLAARGERT